MKTWVGFVVAGDSKSPSKRSLRVERCQALRTALWKAPWCYFVLTLTVTWYLILDFKLPQCCEICIHSLGDPPASEFFMPTFRNTVSSIFISRLNWFLGVWIFCVDVSKRSISSIPIDCLNDLTFRRLNFLCRRFGTLYLLYPHRSFKRPDFPAFELSVSTFRNTLKTEQIVFRNFDT
jgi:hypothetical protein